jgi:hypothetical protein
MTENHDHLHCSECGERRFCHVCPRELDFYQYSKTTERIEAFMDEAEPLMEYVRAEIERNKRRAEMYRKITENVMGTAVLAALGFIGHWLIEKIKFELGVK